MNLAGMQRYPQPDPFLLGVSSIVPDQRLREVRRQSRDQPALRYHRRDEDPIPAVFGYAASPADARAGEGLPRRLIHGIAHGQLVGVGPGRIAEPFHVNDQDGAVNGWLKQLTRLTSCSCGPDSSGGDGPPRRAAGNPGTFPLGNPYQS